MELHLLHVHVLQQPPLVVRAQHGQHDRRFTGGCRLASRAPVAHVNHVQGNE